MNSECSEFSIRKQEANFDNVYPLSLVIWKV